MKVCLRSSPLAEFFDKCFKILISQGFEILIQNLLGHKIICISITVFEEQDFWEKLHYLLPHKKMQRIETNSENPENLENPNQTVIELKPLVNGANQNTV